MNGKRKILGKCKEDRNQISTKGPRPQGGALLKACTFITAMVFNNGSHLVFFPVQHNVKKLRLKGQVSPTPFWHKMKNSIETKKALSFSHLTSVQG